MGNFWARLPQRYLWRNNGAFFPYLTTEEQLREVGMKRKHFTEIPTDIYCNRPLAYTLFLMAWKQRSLRLATMGDQNNLDMTLKQLEITSIFTVLPAGIMKKGSHILKYFWPLLKLALPHKIVWLLKTLPGIEAAQAAGMDVVGVATHLLEKLLALGCVADWGLQHNNWKSKTKPICLRLFYSIILKYLYCISSIK